MSKYAKYADLMKQSTEYAKRMQRLSNRIFGEVVRPTNPKSMKVVRLFSEEPVHLRREVFGYYPRHIETGWLMIKLREYGLYRDEHADFKEEMERMRALRENTLYTIKKCVQEAKCWTKKLSNKSVPWPIDLVSVEPRDTGGHFRASGISKAQFWIKMKLICSLCSAGWLMGEELDLKNYNS